MLSYCVYNQYTNELIAAGFETESAANVYVKVRELKGVSVDLRDINNKTPNSGQKHDAEKLPLHLLPPDALEAITEILQFGANKYAPRNWEKGMAWSRVYRAALGHLFAWFMKRGPDEETGKSHLWHAGCCILFLISYELRNIGTDDRP